MSKFEVVVTAHRPSDRKFWANQIAERLVELVGGVSVYEGKGGWHSPETGVVTYEKHTLLVAHVADPQEIFASMEQTLRQYRESAEQEVVYVVVDDVPYSLNEAVFDALLDPCAGECGSDGTCSCYDTQEDRLNQGIQDVANAILGRK